ncbi:hypothetical protein ACN4EK_26625 [Pantanalinema rosaneae CENA516]
MIHLLYHRGTLLVGHQLTQIVAELAQVSVYEQSPGSAIESTITFLRNIT